MVTQNTAPCQLFRHFNAYSLPAKRQDAEKKHPRPILPRYPSFRKGLSLRNKTDQAARHIMEQFGILDMIPNRFGRCTEISR